jgi:hypothetical protein
MSDTILCPQCQCEIEVTEVLLKQVRAQMQQEFDAAQRRQEQLLAEREKTLAQAKAEVERARQGVADEVAKELNRERRQLQERALAQAREQVTVELRDKEQQLTDAQAKLRAAQEAELLLRKERRDLEEAQQQLELSVQRRVDEERTKLRELAKREAFEEQSLQVAEKERIIHSLRETIEDLKRKSEQGSQQLQGEVFEIALEESLRRQFPYDDITPVPKGVHGGDVLQTIRDGQGPGAGLILWEMKRTRNWNEAWLAKLRDDQRAAKAQLAILVSVELPKGVTTFRLQEGIWITSPACALSLAQALRAGLTEIAAVKRSLEGRQDKMALLYNYLSGPEYRHRVEGIVEAFKTLREELEAEKRATQRAWAKREKQLERALLQTSGMYGDLQGIIGSQLAGIASLEHPRLTSPDDDDS